MRLTAKISGITEALKAAEDKASAAATKTMGRATDSLKAEVREQTTGAGLSERLARTWQGNTYPRGGRKSLSPASYVYTKTPNIIDAYARGVTIVAKNGRKFLSLPTDAVPNKRSGKALTPTEVEARYHSNLRFVPARSAQGSLLGGGKAIGYLLLDNVVPRTGAKVRRASVKELGGTRKRVTSVVMFTLVASVKVPKKLDLQGAANKVAASIPELLAESWGE